MVAGTARSNLEQMNRSFGRVFEKEDPGEEVPKRFAFDTEVPVRISGGTCKVDFRRVLRKIEHFYRMNQ